MEKVNINNETVYLRKRWSGYAVVEPVIDPDTKKIIWKNVFSKKGFISLIILIVIIGLFYLAFKEQLTNYQYVLSHPCEFCKQISGTNINELNLSISPNG